MQWWEKADWSGFKELGAEKSGHNADGDEWQEPCLSSFESVFMSSATRSGVLWHARHRWETWREIYRSDGSAKTIEKSADKWARNLAGEWNEKWREVCTDAGTVDKGADKSGRQGTQARARRRPCTPSAALASPHITRI